MSAARHVSICRSMYHKQFAPIGHRGIPSATLRPRNIIPRFNIQAIRHQSNITSPNPSLRRARFRRILAYGAFAFFFTSVGIVATAGPAATTIFSLVSAPSDAESLKLFHTAHEKAAEINKHITNHPISVALRERPGWTESRPHLRYPETIRPHSLTAGTLMGPGKFPVPPLVFSDDKELVSLSYVGTDMCGHNGIVHGGLLATMLDEGLARCGFNSLPSKIAVTANLMINYRKPVPAGSYLVLRAYTTKAEGRKVWVKGSIELLRDDEKPGDVLVEAEALYVEPKYVKVCILTALRRLSSNGFSLFRIFFKLALDEEHSTLPPSLNDLDSKQ
ncbi:uncharacterized protein KY384_002223 [Bacidia gigantensis]|uniref:uncharacterized protein n=1 Tax=Bacidia gigantensis TaxID=2732470 RepID=UPI001D04D864|nr:uncharacterized protein KY384_002223 [Bacidia gigantensis]KAG8533440.1 hypothetical protein KY384_002223 [Bacidia gigantensis]